nr:MAG TPA: hypothetical protein [Bacteriophage sp.]
MKKDLLVIGTKLLFIRLFFQSICRFNYPFIYYNYEKRFISYCY